MFNSLETSFRVDTRVNVSTGTNERMKTCTSMSSMLMQVRQKIWLCHKKRYSRGMDTLSGEVTVKLFMLPF